MRFEDLRQRLVAELRLLGISSERVLAAFAKIPRELYILPQYMEYAYSNQPLPIDAGQTISQPLMIAIMLEQLALEEQHHVLEIGTGSGYQTALLSELAKDVCSIERIESLSLKAQQVLKSENIKNVYFRIGDGYQGWQKAYPPYKSFDRIIVSAGAPSIPKGLTDQLADGGIMVIPVGYHSPQILTKIIRKGDELQISKHGACAFVPMIEDGE
ncbi:MAG: protein-L-isoaspartate(D-aspartate) O-methyltransferase [Candidatus Cloacimonetes bacterium]|nr:protein-L-isoaspartate(D-aspartate) O-methyltransferase [Candidatus Cloacimonadota bacterium]